GFGVPIPSLCTKKEKLKKKKIGRPKQKEIFYCRCALTTRCNPPKKKKKSSIFFFFFLQNIEKGN
ncbi:hypothetical protein OV760_28985, partial [Salmonella enterica subsp. enterica serovar 1,4,[5],12:i:-]|nr:hypothetical protein [Salmonella enterica subsp. enterica serovar 1,4,[5],12:i:-]